MNADQNIFPDSRPPGYVMFIGTATVLIRYAGFTILTDPNFLHLHEKVYLGYGKHAERLTEPALTIEDLPPIDFVLLSHFHEDHFDKLVQQKLDKSTIIMTTKQSAAKLKKRGFAQATGMEVWESKVFAKDDMRLTLTAVPGRHGPGLMAKLLPDVMGSMLDFFAHDKRVCRVYITGDTLVFDGIQEIPSRFSGIDIALVHLGGTVLYGMMVTMDGVQGVDMLKIIQPKVAIPIHFNDYTVFKSPLSEFKWAVEKAGLQDRVRYLAQGESYYFETADSENRLKRLGP